MVSVSLTNIDGWSNFFFTLLDTPALSLSHGEVGGRLFWFGGNALPDHGVPRWKCGAPEEDQPNRPPPLPAEDIHSLERVVLTFDSAAHPYVQLANKLFSDFRPASAEEPVSVTGSKLVLLIPNVINVISGDPNPLVETVQSHTSFFVGGGRDL